MRAAPASSGHRRVCEGSFFVCALLAVVGCEAPAAAGGMEEAARCFSDAQPEFILVDASADFVPLQDGVEPVLLYGIQGGQHVLVAMRFAGPELDPDGFSVELIAEDGEARCEATDCKWESIGGSTLEVDDYSTLEPGVVESSPTVLVLVRWQPERRRRIRARVTDVCQDTEEMVIEFPPTS